MRQFTAVVSHDKGVVTKYQDFDNKSDADAHVASFGGKVVEGLDNNLEYWDVSGDSPVKDTDQLAADETARVVFIEIHRLESLETPRRLAESVLSDEGKAWLTANRAKIATERGKL